MNKENPFFKQADLLLRVLPHIEKDPDFGLHGGTAINFFVRDMPRLSVDIDLTYLLIESREETLTNITKKLRNLAKKLRNAIPGVRIEEKEDKERNVSKLLVNYQSAIVKIEPNLIIRGSVFSTEERDLSKKAEKTFEKFVSVKTLSFPALYGGKICAALDRQHPRDLFDIKLLFENEGFTDDIRKAFLVYLISSNRPINELLNPMLKDVRKIFENEFAEMALIPVIYEELEQVRKELIKAVKEGFTQEERRFLVSFKEGRPEWGLLDIEGVDKLPAIQWKLTNLAKMDRKKHSQAVDELKKVLEL
jgi:hypothetical protein